MKGEGRLKAMASIRMKNKSLGVWAAPTSSKSDVSARKKLTISVKKLREVTPLSHQERLALVNDDAANVPSVLLANKTLHHKSRIISSGYTAEGLVNKHTGTDPEQLALPEKDAQSSRFSSETYPHKPAVQITSEWKGDAVKQKASDIFISQYDTGQKEAVRAAFKQRIQNVPVFKEVKVNLLNHVCPDKDSSKSTQSEMDSAATIAAATAAAIASTAPLLKVQSDLEAKVNSVSEMLNKLQETDKQLQRVAEQQASLKTQQLEGSSSNQMVGKLEEQMNVFMEQRIQHLENLQQQQMNIQSQLISSALNSGGFQTVKAAPFKELSKHAVKAGKLLGNQTTPQEDLFLSRAANTQVYSRQLEKQGVHIQKSPLKTPAPRRYAPMPVSKDAQISQKLAKKELSFGEKENMSCGKTLGGGKLLEQILKAHETPLNPSTSSEVTNRAVPWHLESEHRISIPQTAFSVFKSASEDLDSIGRTVKKADDVLHDLGQLKREMHNILQDAKEWKSDMNDFVKTTSYPKEAEKRKDHLSSHQPVPSSEVLLKMPPQTEQRDLLELQQLSKSSILQSNKASKSILRDAEKILRTVRKNKRLLEENLEAIIRAKDADALHAFIDELTADRDVLEEIRIRKTVDEWIKTISMEIQDEMARKDYLKAQQAVKTSNREIYAKSHYGQRIPPKRHLPTAKPSPKRPDKQSSLKTRLEAQNEEYLSQVYGRPVYQGHRSTLKKSPYLRFNSPPPKSKPPRPKVIESVKGTKVKSTRTQTSPHLDNKVISSKKPELVSAFHQELQYLFSPTKAIREASGSLEGHLIPMAIPLGQKQINLISPQPSEIKIGEFHPVTVATSILPPSSAPPSKSKVSKPSVTIIEMKSEKKDPPKLTMQTLPNIDIDSISSDTTNENQVSLLSGPAKATIQPTSEDSLLQDEELKLPGANFVDATDITQEEGDDDRMSQFSEPFLHFSRQGDISSPKYNGPPFPPVAPAPQVSADILDEIIEKQELLENKLISWVEQEVMARVISGMYPAQKEVIRNLSSSESEESQAVSSDIVEAAGAKGIQLFVDTGIPVDSEMIRHFVNEALAERVAVMLGNRESEKAALAPVVSSSVPQLPEKEIILSTPSVTPESTPSQSPPPIKESFTVKTPESSMSINEMDEDVGAIGSEAVVVSPVHTPVVTPTATPIVGSPSPPISDRTLDTGVMKRQPLPNAWGDTELPLEEEKPSPQSEDDYNPTAVIMSVGQHEEPEILILPISPELPQTHSPLPAEPRAPSPSVETSSSDPSEESSPTTTETEAPDRPISEGEILYSYGQLLAAKALAEGGLSFPNLSDSLASTLHDAHEMDYDPPSEGQVIQRPHRGAHRDQVLSLFSKLNQAPLTLPEESCHSEDSDNSAGELSEGQRPRLTKAAESILMGHSVYMGQATSQVSKELTQQMTPSGQCDHFAGDILGVPDVTHGPMSIAELAQPDSLGAYGNANLTPQLDDSLQTKPQEAFQEIPVNSRIICVKPKSEHTQQKGTEVIHHLSPLPAPGKVSVKVPSADIEDKTPSFSSVHGSSSSSGPDTF
ncbi:protein TALPID3 isoform X3 [Ahaetulla prasina]|uniref:protein TALPID3 isoform X3 n=1 Tax=Ahaetulla prasina TaxID=499056 RepID=UPI0026493864|nr:protein TALPID3 isoform X3 [Ahaetulla prasina]